MDRRKTGMKRLTFGRLALCVLCGAILYALLPASLVHAQQRWTKTYGGTAGEEGYSVRQTTDGGYIVAGWTDSYGAGFDDVYLIKTNASGDTLWTRTFGGTYHDEGWSVRQTFDGGYVIAGYASSFPVGTWDVYLIKTNASGNTLWQRTYGGSSYDYGYSVWQTADTGYIIVGETDSYGAGGGDVYLIKTNALGDTLWTRTYGGSTLDEGYSVQQTRDRGYIIAGYTTSFGAGNGDIYLIKTNASGDTLWTRTYGGTSPDSGFSVQQTSEGGYIIAGATSSFGAGGYDVYLVKTDSLGHSLWTKTYGGTADDYGRSVQQTADGGYIIAGYTYSFGAGEDAVYLIKTNAAGDTLWTRTYGGTDFDYGFSVQQTADGGYIISGGTTSYGAGYADVYLIKTDANGNVGVETPVRQLDGSTVRQLKATPNPFISFATLPGHEAERFSLYDISGRKVGTYRGDRVGEGVAPGVYFLRPLKGDSRPVRIVKVR
jgi:hypothetical protein